MPQLMLYAMTAVRQISCSVHPLKVMLSHPPAMSGSKQSRGMSAEACPHSLSCSREGVDTAARQVSQASRQAKPTSGLCQLTGTHCERLPLTLVTSRLISHASCSTLASSMANPSWGSLMQGSSCSGNMSKISQHAGSTLPSCNVMAGDQSAEHDSAHVRRVCTKCKGIRASGTIKQTSKLSFAANLWIWSSTPSGKVALGLIMVTLAIFMTEFLMLLVCM